MFYARFPARNLDDYHYEQDQRNMRVNQFDRHNIRQVSQVKPLGAREVSKGSQAAVLFRTGYKFFLPTPRCFGQRPSTPSLSPNHCHSSALSLLRTEPNLDPAKVANVLQLTLLSSHARRIQ